MHFSPLRRPASDAFTAAENAAEALRGTVAELCLKPKGDSTGHSERYLPERVQQAAAAAVVRDEQKKAPTELASAKAQSEELSDPRPTENSEKVERFAHGTLGEADWPDPKQVAVSSEEARPGFSSCSADEFMDAHEVFQAKAALVASLIKKSAHCTAYTGAGISTSSGIKDYATKAERSLVHSVQANAHRDDKRPTKAHRALAALYRNGSLGHWLQQNHDGLPQEAGVPQEVLNEIHGAWFDPSNPVVHFRGELRPDLFGWMLDEELQSDLVLAVGTSLCDTPSTADRFVVSAANRATKESPATALGSVVVGLQKTRLDHYVQVRVYGLIDDFFDLVASNILGPGWDEDSAIVQNLADQLPWGEAATLALGNHEVEGLVGRVVYITAGPSKGRACRILKAPADGPLQLDFGFPIGRWWLNCPVHPACFPISEQTVQRCARYRKAMEAAMVVSSTPPKGGVPRGFLPGIWSGSAVLISRERMEHPTAAEDRAQHMRFVIGRGSGDVELIGAGYTTWPAAHVMQETRGRVWFTFQSVYDEKSAELNVNFVWEAIPGSRIAKDGLGPGQGDFKSACTELQGRIWWDQRNGCLQFGGHWQDQESIQGAFIFTQEDAGYSPTSRAGSWKSPCSHMALALLPGSKPSIFGALYNYDGSDANRSLRLVRGYMPNCSTNTCDPSVFSLESDIRLRLAPIDVGKPWVELNAHWHGDKLCVPAENLLRAINCEFAGTNCNDKTDTFEYDRMYSAAEPKDLIGNFLHSAGDVVEVKLETASDGSDNCAPHLVINNPRISGVARVPLLGACAHGFARLFNQQGRLHRGLDNLALVWSNGSVWRKVNASISNASERGEC